MEQLWRIFINHKGIFRIIPGKITEALQCLVEAESLQSIIVDGELSFVVSGEQSGRKFQML